MYKERLAVSELEMAGLLFKSYPGSGPQPGFGAAAPTSFIAKLLASGSSSTTRVHEVVPEPQ